MSIRIIKSGLSDTIQDQGRPGYAGWGINPGGVMDTAAARIASALVGNPDGSPVIEMHFPASQIEFVQDSLIAITGADFHPEVNDRAIPCWRPVQIKAKSILSFRRKTSGARCYVAIHGQWSVDRWLGSYSTHSKVGRGGFGRALRVADQIPIKPSLDLVKLSTDFQSGHLGWFAQPPDLYNNPDEISFIPSGEYEWLNEESRDKLTQYLYQVDPASDRMATRLIHPPLQYQVTSQLLSSAVVFGTIQALPDGSLLILMADHQTTGGYPRIGTVITAHLPKLAQLAPGQRFQLKHCAVPAAEKMLLSMNREISRIEYACRFKLATYEKN